MEPEIKSILDIYKQCQRVLIRDLYDSQSQLKHVRIRFHHDNNRCFIEFSESSTMRPVDDDDHDHHRNSNYLNILEKLQTLFQPCNEFNSLGVKKECAKCKDDLLCCALTILSTKYDRV
ncbi:CLUMA_CG014722, isoform A [Clunio marinus]|uniref:CLUMA_CG014722, isoform A n=1 Tax=Clunio marinus TaxID=568069 RepID=A0A1J1IMZ9_9DIPT|nr:CLUMA_CG014722, isoform A [Clunio marinus]